MTRSPLDDRDAELALEAVLGHVLAFGVGQARVVEAGDGHGLPCADGHGGGREAVDVEDVAHDAGVQPVAVGADQAAERVVLQREDVAVRGVDGVAQPLRERRQHRLEVVGLRRDCSELDDVAKHRRASLQLVDEAGVLEGAGQRLRGAAQEGEVLREVALARVVDVEQPVEFVVDHQRQADLAREAVVVVGGALVLVQLGIVGAGDGQDLVAVHGRDGGRVALEVEDAAEHVVVVAAAVVAGDAAERPVQHAVDVAVGRVNGRRARAPPRIAPAGRGPACGSPVCPAPRAR